MKRQKKNKKQAGVTPRVALSKEQVCFLDKVITEIRFKSRKKLSRSKVLDAIYKSMGGMDIDVTGVRSEKEILLRILKTFESEKGK